MRAASHLALFALLGSIALAEDAPERFKLHWGFAKDMKLEQTLTVRGEAEEYGAAGLQLEMRTQVVCTKDDACDFLIETVSLKGTSGGPLALKLDYQDGAWKEASAGGADAQTRRVEEVDGKRCARIAWSETAESDGTKETMHGTYWLAIDEGYLAKASLVVGCTNTLKATVKPLSKFSVEVTSRVP